MGGVESFLFPRTQVGFRTTAFPVLRHPQVVEHTEDVPMTERGLMETLNQLHRSTATCGCVGGGLTDDTLNPECRRCRQAVLEAVEAIKLSERLAVWDTVERTIAEFSAEPQQCLGILGDISGQAVHTLKRKRTRLLGRSETE